MDGAPWLQELIDEQCPQAVHILDFPHAVGYLSRVAQAAFGAGSREAAVWLDDWAPTLKRDTPEVVVAAIRALPAPRAEAATAKGVGIRYLSNRMDQLRSAVFQAQRYPIGSGIVESAGKLVVEARLKGSRVPRGLRPLGCHWAPRNLNPLLALRGRLCSGQWAQTWAGIWREWRAHVVHQRDDRRGIRHAQRAAETATQSAPATVSQPKPERATTIIDGHPTEAHPWKQYQPQSAA